MYPEVPPRVEYALTDVGRSLEPLVEQVDRWGHWYREHFRTKAGDGDARPASETPTS